MALTNSQRKTIAETAKASGYTGDVTALFRQAELEGIFNKVEEKQAPAINLTREELLDNFKLSDKSLLVDKTPHKYTENENFISSNHSVNPNLKSITRFLNDPDYTPTAEPNMGADGGFEKQFNTNYKEADGGIKKYTDGGANEKKPIITNTRLNTNLEIQKGLNLKTSDLTLVMDGEFNSETSDAMLSWSNKNLSGLPIYDPSFITKNIKCKSGGCSEQVTNTLQLLYPHLDRESLDPQHSWFRRDKILKGGGTDVWSQEVVNKDGGAVPYRYLNSIPPMETWSSFQVGDIVHLNSAGDRHLEYTDDANGNINDGTEHTGFIIGRDPKTGMPLIMHGTGGKMEVDPMNDITIGESSQSYDGSTSSTYTIGGISRPSSIGDGEKNNYNFDKLSMFLEKPEFKKHNEFSFDEDYLANMDKNDLTMANAFTDFFNGRILESLPITYEEAMRNRVRLEGRSESIGESKFTKDYPIENIANITGYTKDEVSKAAMMTWGFYKNETSDVGLGSGAQMGKLKQFIKDSLSTKNAAKLKALTKADVSFSPLGIFGDWINEDEYIYSAKQEASLGILRIKHDMQVKNAHGDQTRVGDWFSQYGLTKEDLTAEDSSENTLITGIPGGQGVANSFAAGTMLTLSYYEDIRRKPDYDAETETYKGIPIDYVVATMHKGKNLNSQAGDGNTILENLQKGNRGYSNITLNNANKLSYNTYENSYIDMDDKAQREQISTNTKPFTSAINFINEKK